MAAAVVAALVAAPAAAAKSFSLPQADVDVAVRPDGSLDVAEHITFFFSGQFTGAYREIPVRNGESLEGAYVAEGGKRYRPGASAELGSSGAPGTFGIARTEKERGSSGTTRPTRRNGRSRLATGCGGSPWRTTTWWT
jgi:hypothetical protein